MEIVKLVVVSRKRACNAELHSKFESNMFFSFSRTLSYQCNCVISCHNLMGCFDWSINLIIPSGNCFSVWLENWTYTKQYAHLADNQRSIYGVMPRKQRENNTTINQTCSMLPCQDLRLPFWTDDKCFHHICPTIVDIGKPKSCSVKGL